MTVSNDKIIEECKLAWSVSKGETQRWPNTTIHDTYEFRRKYNGILYYCIDVKLGPEVYQQFEIPNVANGKPIFSSFNSLAYAIEYFITHKFPDKYFPHKKMTKIQTGTVNKNDIDYDILLPLITKKKDCILHDCCRALFLWNSKFKQPKKISNPKFHWR